MRGEVLTTLFSNELCRFVTFDTGLHCLLKPGDLEESVKLNEHGTLRHGAPSETLGGVGGLELKRKACVIVLKLCLSSKFL